MGVGLANKGIFERGTFTVPASVTDERVQMNAEKYMRTFGCALEKQGFTVLEMSRPVVSLKFLPEPGLRRYMVLARCIRKPEEVHIDVPDAAVPALLAKGLKLNE